MDVRMISVLAVFSQENHMCTTHFKRRSLGWCDGSVVKSNQMTSPT